MLLSMLGEAPREFETVRTPVTLKRPFVSMDDSTVDQLRFCFECVVAARLIAHIRALAVVDFLVCCKTTSILKGLRANTALVRASVQMPYCVLSYRRR